MNRRIDLGNHSGLFLLSIQPDGTVANVKTLPSLGVRELDERALGRISRMTFDPERERGASPDDLAVLQKPLNQAHRDGTVGDLKL